MDMLFSGVPFVPTMTVLAVIGDVLWLVAYILIIRESFRTRTYGVPMVAICLNFTWELHFGILNPPPDLRVRILHALWFLVDCVIVWQLLRYGKRSQSVAEARHYFYPLVALSFLLAYVGQTQLHYHMVANNFFPDTSGGGIAFLINLIMSILFVSMFFGRPGQVGLSLGAAWAKMLGTGLISLGNFLVLYGVRQPVNYELQSRPVATEVWTYLGEFGTSTYTPGYYYYLFLSILLFDLIYILLLHRRRRLGAG